MTDPIQPFEKSSKLRLHEIMLNNFIGGIMWALGATVGISLFFTVLGMLAQQINFVPIVGSFTSEVLNFILSTNPNLQNSPLR